MSPEVGTTMRNRLMMKVQTLHGNDNVHDGDESSDNENSDSIEIVPRTMIEVTAQKFSTSRIVRTITICGIPTRNLPKDLSCSLGGGLVVRSRLWGRRVPGSKPDFTIVYGAYCTLNHT
ncbi:hypothetical protein AVEN_128430-1 [Araneus ventricosus]|uniref:Uncharacterized protein n=1 Tax=Araneus ventricosus TaxID=182803 RepID=A0A4Y2GKN3_ARAVE|nr:hypothetical protein AVEN_128430-1 [Araneus ventricosus]